MAVLVLLTLSCSMDLEPVKAGDTAVSFTIGTLLPPANAFTLPDSAASRAVAPGLGYLYIRTVGGPTGSNGPFYGPFSLASGDTFTTTNIPAGTYEGIGILYATERLDDLTTEWEGQTRTFAELMRLPDDKFKLLTDDADLVDGPAPLDLLLDGRASGEMLSPVTIVANKNNPLSLTLVPLCGASRIIMSEIPTENVYTETGDSNRIIRKFIEIDGIVLPPEYTGNLICTIAADGSPYIGTVAMFGEDGRQVGTTTTINAALTANRTVSVPWTGDDTYYLYIEYRAASLSLAFSSDEEPVVVEEGFITLNIAGGTPNAKVLAGISPYTGEGTEEQPAVAVVVMTLDGTGSGSAQFVDIETGEPYQFPAGQWFLNGFIDVNENYSDITAGEPLASILDIEPHHGDLTFEGLLPTTDGTDMDLPVISEFDTENTYIYYISQTGTGDGQRVATAMSLADFVTELSTGGQLRSIHAYIIDDIQMKETAMLTIDNVDDVVLSSLDPADTNAILVDLYAFITVHTASTLALHNITIDGSKIDSSSPLSMVYGTLILDDKATLQNRINNEGPGGVVVMDGGTLIMNEGSVITNCTGGAGGGVGLYSDISSTPATFTMNGGMISGCMSDFGGGISAEGYVKTTLNGGTISACETEGGNGGGIYIMNSNDDEAAILNLFGVSIEYCFAGDGAGGGVYAGGNTIVTMQDGTDQNPNDGIYRCSAFDGAGFYIGSGGGLATTLEITGGTVSGCNATNQGGGVYAYGMYVQITMSGGTIDTCTATNGGGGFYLFGSANLSLSGTALISDTTTQNKPLGWAIAYIQGSIIYPDPVESLNLLQGFIEVWDENALWEVMA